MIEILVSLGWIVLLIGVSIAIAVFFHLVIGRDDG